MLALAALLLLAGCSGDAHDGRDHGGGVSAPAEAAATDSDVMIASMMIPHHEQAVEMSDTLLAEENIDERVTRLASDIKDAQQPEIDKMRGWLSDWGAVLSDGDTLHHGDGMMSQDDMEMLSHASGAEAERLFLSQMIAHHRGAVEMAQDEIENGSNPAAVSLAKSIVERQMAETVDMEQLQG